MVSRLKTLPYNERLRELNLPTLRYRRLRGDMIELFKMIMGIYNNEISLGLQYNTSNLRGNRYKLFQRQIHYDLRKFSFSNRIINVWNSLPDAVVAVNDLNSFKTALDRYWTHQDMKYNWKSELSGLGSRTVKIRN